MALIIRCHVSPKGKVALIPKQAVVYCPYKERAALALCSSAHWLSVCAYFLSPLGKKEDLRRTKEAELGNPPFLS